MAGINKSRNTKPIALEIYEQIADRYSEYAPYKLENAYVEKPALFGLLGPVEGLRVLDAGCGPGIGTKRLLEAGARVTAIDISPRMIELAHERTGEGADFMIANLEEPLDFFKPGSFDRIVSSLAIDYIEDWSPLFCEFHRILVPGGILVFSVQHPTGAYLFYKPERAVGVQYVEGTWRSFGPEPFLVPDYYRSFSDIVNPLIEASFLLEKVVEAVPNQEGIDKWPEDAEELIRKPSFLCIRAKKG